MSKKATGILFCFIGVFLARINIFFDIKKDVLFFICMLGVLIAITGLAFFAAGLKRIERKIKICSFCYKKNDAEEKFCIKCKKPFL